MTPPETPTAPTAPPFAPTPWPWRAALFAVVIGLAALATFGGDSLAPRVRSGLGLVGFLTLAVAASATVRAVNWRVVAAGFALQVSLALAITQIPPVYRAFAGVGDFIKQLLEFTKPSTDTLFGPAKIPPLALIIVPTVIFVASLSAVLFHLGVLQFVVRQFARGVGFLMGRRGVSGAETLSVVANVFIGQTEAPLVIAPYVSRMTRSELMTIMTSGMAHIAGGVMAIYISRGADPVAILTTSIMAAPCAIYIAKILMPETEEPVTRGNFTTVNETTYSSVIDAAAAGASSGMRLAINIIAMLLAFGALIVMTDFFLGQLGRVHESLAGLSLRAIFAALFAPAAALMGVDSADVPKVAELLGIKLVGNEFLAYEAMTANYKPGTDGGMSARSYVLTTYALTGFANISSIGIQIGGIGSLPRTDAEQSVLRGKLARLGPRALFGGFLATLINAAVAGILLAE